MLSQPVKAGRFAGKMGFLPEYDPELRWRMVKVTPAGLNWYVIYDVSIAVNITAVGEIKTPRNHNQRGRAAKPLGPNDEVPRHYERATYTRHTLRRFLFDHLPDSRAASEQRLDDMLAVIDKGVEDSANWRNLDAAEIEYDQYWLGQVGEVLGDADSPWLLDAGDRVNAHRDFKDVTGRVNPQASGVSLRAAEQRIGRQQQVNEKTKSANRKNQVAFREFNGKLEHVLAHIETRLLQPPTTERSRGIYRDLELMVKPEWHAANWIRSLLRENPESEAVYLAALKALTAEKLYHWLDDCMSLLKREPELYQKYQTGITDVVRNVNGLELPLYRELNRKMSPHLKELGKAFLVMNKDKKKSNARKAAEAVQAVMRDRLEPIWLPPRLHRLTAQ